MAGAIQARQRHRSAARGLASGAGADCRPAGVLTAINRRHPFVIAVLFVTALALLLTGVFVGRTLWRENDVYAKPDSVDLPPAPKGATLDQTRAYLASREGGAIRGLLEISGGLVESGPSVADCRSVAEQDLPRIGPPGEVYRFFGGVPDQPTAELALAHLDATARFLARCLQNNSVELDELRFTRVVLVRRLAELA